jgi:hypothetical protein
VESLVGLCDELTSDADSARSYSNALATLEGGALFKLRHVGVVLV